MQKEKSHLVIGIDIGSNTTKVCAVYHYEDKNIAPKIFALEEIETKGVYRGTIVEEKAVAETIHKIIKRLGDDILKKKPHIVLSLNTFGINSIINNASIVNSTINNEITSIDLDKLEKEATISLANIKNKRIIHTIPIKYKVDYNEVSGSPLSMFGKRIEGKFLFVFCPNIYIEKIENILKEINLNIEEVVVGPFAESIPLLKNRQKVAGTALVNIGHSTTSLIVYENNSPILSSIIGVGSNDITNDIALGLQISLEEAEEVKTGISNLSFSKRKLEDIIDARLEFLSEKINIELDRINRRELLPGGIVLTGGGSKLEKIDSILKNYLKLPVRFADDEIREFSDGQLNDSIYARVYGLTFLAPIVDGEYNLNKIFSKILKYLSTFFKKILP